MINKALLVIKSRYSLWVSHVHLSFFFFLPQTAILNQGSLGPRPPWEMSGGVYDCWDFDAKWMDGAMLLAFSGQRPEKCWRGTRQPFITKSWHNLLENINASKKFLSKIPHCLSLEWRLLILTQDYIISTLKRFILIIVWLCMCLACT